MQNPDRTMMSATGASNQKPHADSTATTRFSYQPHDPPIRVNRARLDRPDGDRKRSQIEWRDYEAGEHRIPCPACGRGGSDKTAGLTIDGGGRGVMHCFRCAYVETSSPDCDAMTPAERTAMQQRLQAAQRERDADRRFTQQQAACEAQRRWSAATPATTSPYLSTKGIGAHGSRVERDHLLIAMHDPAGTVRSLQTITPDGSKRFLPGGAVRGLMHLIGRPSGNVIVCEGFATGASIHEATGSAVAVAFNCGNLEPVARAIRARFPRLSIVIAADDDWCTEGNPGRTKATEAALAVGGVVMLPYFPAQRSKKATDFNDLHQLAGPAAVRACFAEVEVL